jgi:multidrug efflux pump subunit AcrB
MLAILSGTYATVVVLVPLIFIGGYVQTVLRPLTLTLSIALLASYVVSVTIIPIFAPTILRLGGRIGRTRFELGMDKRVTAVMDKVQSFFVGILDIALRHKVAFIAVALVMLAFTGRVLMPLIGRDLMPPMDTGIFKISAEAYPNASLEATEALLKQTEALVWANPDVIRSASTLGSEPGVLSFGSGRNPQQMLLTVHLKDRFHRKQTMWEIEHDLQARIRALPGIRQVAAFDYGATPLSTVRSTVDIMISGPDPIVLDKLAADVKTRLEKVGGLTAVTRTWTLDRLEYRFIPDGDRMAQYGIDAAAVAAQVSAQVKGLPATLFRVPQQDSFAVWTQARGDRRGSDLNLSTLPVATPSGLVPLSALGRITQATVPTLHTRQGLQETVDVLAYRNTVAVTHLNDRVTEALKGLQLPTGYSLSDEGERKAMDESFALLMAGLVLGLVLLYFSLVPAFNSWIHPLTIMVAIPLGIIGASWALLATGKHSCMPSFMGMILLAGIVVKNSILLIDFIEESRAQGMSLREALEGSVRVRTRPILMTAFGTAVGMLPIALEWAIGLERLSPLAIVAIGGLLVSTFLTLVYVPMFYELFEQGREALLRRKQRRDSVPNDAPTAP